MKKNLLKIIMCICLVAVVICGCGNDSERTSSRADREEGHEDDNAFGRDMTGLESLFDGAENENNRTEENIIVESSNTSGVTADINESTAETWGACGADLTWYYQNNILVIRGTGEMDNYIYYRSDQPWYDLLDNIYQIYIEDGVSSVGEYAFWGCSSLTDINISGSVTSIREGAFYECSSLTSINIPDSVTAIGELAFDNCSSLTNINIPDSVTTIGSGAFGMCNNLTVTYQGQEYTIENDTHGWW